jgi:ribosome-associated protein
MSPEELKCRNLENEFIFSTSRSSGPGGQNVNKVSTKVELRFDLESTELFNPVEKERIFTRLKNKISKDNEIILVSQSARTQLANKNNVIEKFYEIVSKALTVPKKRKPTQPTLSSKLKRLDTKKSRGFMKKLRTKNNDFENT